MVEMFGEKRGGLNLWQELGSPGDVVVGYLLWRATENSRVNFKTTNPTKLRYPSQKTTAQKDVTAETALKSTRGAQ
jgi:hypothetical protein